MVTESEKREKGASQKPPAVKPKRATVARWQERLLPIMVGMLIGLSIIFFGATLLQLTYLNRRIGDIPHVELPDLSATLLAAADDSAAAELAARKLEVLATMEAYLVERRYHQASVMLMAGLWTRYLGFVTGMILALVGASFILGKLQESPSELTGEGSGLAVSLKTASPGIVLVVLGTILMLATIVNRDTYSTNEKPAYLLDWTAPVLTNSTPTAPPALPFTPEATPQSSSDHERGAVLAAAGEDDPVIRKEGSHPCGQSASLCDNN